MILGKKVVVVMPAYNAARTLETTVAEIDREIVDQIVLVDDCSQDGTSQIAERLGLKLVQHETNLGYGGNQKTCYREALELGADIVVMVHPDYQYTPKLIPAMVGLLAHDQFDIAMGSRILGGGAIRGGMPLYKYIANRFLTLFQNWLTGMKLSEYHTGYRAFTARVLRNLPLDKNSDDFIFDNQMLLQAHFAGYRVGEITCPTKYEKDSSSISFGRSVKYGLGCLWTGWLYRMAKLGVYRSNIFRMQVPAELPGAVPQQK